MFSQDNANGGKSPHSVVLLERETHRLVASGSLR